MSTILLPASQLPPHPSSKARRRRSRPHTLQKIDTLLSLTADSLPSPHASLATPPPSYDSLYAVTDDYVLPCHQPTTTKDPLILEPDTRRALNGDMKEKPTNKMVTVSQAQEPAAAENGGKGLEKMIQAESLLSSLAGMLDDQNDAMVDLKSQLFGIEDVLKELHVQQEELRQAEASAMLKVASVKADSEPDHPTTSEPPKPYPSRLTSIMPTPHPSLSSPAVITKSTKRSSLTPAPATRPRRHSLSTDPSTSPTEDESNEAFERISGILSSLIVEATEAVHGTDDDKSHILRRTGSRASLARPKSRLSLRWDSETDSDQSDDEEEVGQKSDSEASDSEHDAAVAAVTTTRLYYGQSDAEEDEADSEEEWARGEDLENVRKSPMLVSAANVAVQAVDDEDDLCQSPKLLEDPSCRKLDAIEQARRRLLGLDSERAEQKVQPRSRPSSWSSSASTSVDEPTPSPSTSWSRRSLGEVPTPTVSSSRSRRGFVDPPKPTVSTSRSNRSTVEPPVPNPSTSSCSRRSMIESPTPTRSSSRSRSSMVESPTPTPSSSSASRRSLLRPKHMSFDINPNNELLESMKRVDDSLAEIDSLSKDLAGENDYDDASPENIAIVTANGSLPNPATATTSRWRNISTDADKISFAVQRQQAQHPSQGPPSPTAQSSAPVFSFLESFTPSMRARIITSILFSLLHIPHAFVAESLSNVAAAFNSSPAKFSLPYMADSAPLCIANVLTWTIFFTVGSFMVDSMTGGSVASIADVWRQNGFVKHGVRGRVIASKVNADDDEILLQEGEGDAYHRPSRVRRLAKDGVAHEPSIGEAGVPGGYYPTKSEYDSCMPLDKGDMAGMFPGTYYYRCVCDGGMRKPNETPLREDERKHDGPVRHRHVEYTHHSLPATFRPENCATGGSVAPLRRALHAATQKRVMVVHDLDGGKTDVIAMENAKEGAEGEVLEVVVVKRKRAGTGASIGKGGVLLVGRRNSL